MFVLMLASCCILSGSSRVRSGAWSSVANDPVITCVNSSILRCFLVFFVGGFGFSTFRPLDVSASMLSANR
eukprot:CAMPEP_0204499390 /NCGR_PEP_ID=MMETSP0471-20130131/94939_1 /ASSEMBLY_ACC=CAM_ASM_000602 /TAXON_ID=2969 /ORGANISM="Oxyrrhis marina" /LENGTH=70 /DNA_ID=CAMNT_0051503933 /DNA_START=39 /DNA_END=251 /DNA_ORIENTATION=+